MWHKHLGAVAQLTLAYDGRVDHHIIGHIIGHRYLYDKVTCMIESSTLSSLTLTLTRSPRLA